MTGMVAGLALAGTLVGATGIVAQDRWGFELRAGAAVPTQELGDVDLGTGFGFEGTLDAVLVGGLAAYAGWDWHRFTPDDGFAGPDVDVEETGYALGLRYDRPLGATATPFIRVRAGGTYNHIELEDDDELAADSGHGVGWEAGAGLGFALGSGWRVIPAARYRSLSRSIEIDAAETDVDLTYVALEVAFSKRF